MKKILLGSTALVAAGLMAGPAFAQLELSISGSVDVHAGFTSEQLDAGRRAIGITTDTTLNFDADGVADNGLEYGSRINVDDSGDAFKIDETWVYVSGTFGEVRFGATDPAASELRFAIPTVGNGQADGDFGRYVNGVTDDNFVFGTDFIYSSDDNKIVYIGEFGDFSVAASYSPTDASVGSDPAMGENDSGTPAALGDLEDIISLGANYQGEFNGVSVGVSGGFNIADFEQTAPAATVGDLSDLTEYGFGGEVGFGAITAGGFWINSTSDINGGGDAELNAYGLGATFTTGPWGFAANALIAETEVGGVTAIEDTVYGVGVEYSLADGLTPYADLVFFDNDIAGGSTFDNDGSVFLVGVTASF